ncbi:MAG TPA: D-glucuronyl C5-epimerase family protein, partial [Acidobacteriaceae bacterium]|nr:D-glucuronyl C5-epimerase family protein [Acidobacteriaceae bacterium]
KAVYADLNAAWKMARSLGYRVIASTLPSRADINNYQGRQKKAQTLNRLILSDRSDYSRLIRADILLPNFNNLQLFSVDGINLSKSGNALLASYPMHAASSSRRFDFTIDKRRVQCGFHKFAYLRPYLAPYSPQGDYLSIGTRFDPKNWHVPFDKQGLPLLASGKSYSPIALTQFALIYYQRMQAHVPGAKETFWRAVEKIVSLLGPDGALSYPFPFTYYLNGKTLQPGWHSPIAQGQTLSVLARAYYLSHDERYAKAGQRALAFLLRPRTEGGLRSDLRYLPFGNKRLVWFEEYYPDPKHDPPAYTLNGFMTTMLGLYDWAHLAPAQDGAAQASDYFKQAVKSLQIVLPHYDSGFFSIYDLGYITYPGTPPRYGLDYHAYHVTLLNALNSVVSRPLFRAVIKRWQRYAEEARATNCSAAQRTGRGSL